MNKPKETRKILARGTMSHFYAKIVFFLCNFAINIALARLLGVNLYGIFGVVMALNSILATVVYNATVEAISKLTAEHPNFKYEILKSSLNIQTYFSIILVLTYFLAAETIASLLGNMQLKILIMISAFSILPWGILATYEGTLGGLRYFGRQAFIIGLNSVSKFIAVLSLILLGYKLNGAIFGYAISIVPGVILARYFCSKESKEKHGAIFPYKKIIYFTLPLIVNNLLYILVINLDLLLVQMILRDSIRTGLYVSISTIAKSVWIFFAAFGTTLLPSISKSISENDLVLTKRYIRQSLRYLVMSVVPIAFLLSGLSRGIIRMFYTSKFIEAAGPFRILIFGLSIFTIFTLLTTIITGSGKPKISLLFGLITLITAFILNKIMIPNYGLIGAAIGSSVAFLCGTVIASVYVYRRFKTLINPYSLIKIVGSSLVIWLIAVSFPVTGLYLILQAIGLLAIYLLLLFAFKEIGEQDFQVISNIVR